MFDHFLVVGAPTGMREGEPVEKDSSILYHYPEVGSNSNLNPNRNRNRNNNRNPDPDSNPNGRTVGSKSKTYRFSASHKASRCDD